MTQRPGWMRRAACLIDDLPDPDMFFPTSSREHGRIRSARALCRFCPSLRECALWAVQQGQTDGIHAGVLLPGLSRAGVNRCGPEYRALERVALTGRIPDHPI